MKFKSFMVILGVVCLAGILVFSWGCQNQPTGPTGLNNTGSYKLRASGTNGGYYWGTYYEGSGSMSYSFPSAASIRCTWTSGTNCAGCGKGWKPGSIRTVQYVVNERSNVHCNSVYGWTQNPLVEYYISNYGSHGGTSLGTLNSDGKTYNCYRQQRTNAPSIEGTRTFWQAKNSATSSTPTGQTVTVTMRNHFNFWESHGVDMGSSVYDAVVYSEAFSGPGSCQLTIGSGGGSTTTTSTTTTTSGGYTTTTTSGGGGSNSIVVRARGTAGSEHIYVTVSGSQIGNWTLSTSYQNYSASTNNSGNINVCFDNDDGTNRDVQVDYITVNGSTRQAEDQSSNTGVWQNSSCGGSYSEWLHCEGCIGFGDVGGGGGATTTAATTTTSGSSWWGGGGWW